MPGVKKSENVNTQAVEVKVEKKESVNSMSKNVKTKNVKSKAVVDANDDKNSKKNANEQVVSQTPAPSPSQSPAPSVAPVDTAHATVVSASENQEAPSDGGLTLAFSEAFAKLHHVSLLLSSLKTEFRQLEKRASRELKVANKASNRRRRKSGNRSPSGFVKPTLISDELACFLGKTSGTEMARTEVTREINAYIRQHNLQDKDNGRKINPDNNLSKLLKLNESDELTYFNLQRYMSPHFAKAVKAEAK